MNVNRHHPMTRLLMTMARIGKRHSAATRAKMSRSQRRRRRLEASK